jgi:hypothetical protein
MDTQPAFGLQALLTHIVGGIANAIGERQGESRQQKSDRTQAAAHAVMAFMPRDAVEAMISGHCVMLHEMMVDSVHDTLRGEATPARRATRANIIAMDKAFGNNLARLERYRRRLAEGRRDAVAAKAGGETDIADRIRRHRATKRPGPGGQQVPSGQSRVPEPAAVRVDPATPGTTCATIRPVESDEEARAGAVPSPGGSRGSLPAPRPPETAPGRKEELVMVRGFQNRRARRANRKLAAASSRLTVPPGQPRRAPLAPASG